MTLVDRGQELDMTMLKTSAKSMFAHWTGFSRSNFSEFSLWEMQDGFKGSF